MKIIFLLLIALFIQTACKTQAVKTNQQEQAKLLYSWDFEGADSHHTLGIEDICN